MFAATIHVREWFLMEQGDVSMSVESFLKNFHHNHVMIDGLASLLEKRAEFVLINSYLSMSGFNWNSDFE